MTTGQADKKSRLQMQIRKYITILVIVAGTLGTVCFVIGGFVHSWKNPVNLLANAFLTIAITIVPCGEFIKKDPEAQQLLYERIQTPA